MTSSAAVAAERMATVLVAAMDGTGGGSRLSAAAVDLALPVGLVLIAVGLAGIAYCYWSARRSELGAQHDPEALFAELCAAHELGDEDRRLLADLAAASRLDPSPRIFLEPQRFQAEALPEPLAGQAERLLALRARLFGGSALD